MTALLEVRELSARFGGVQALDGVDLEVGEWEVVGLVGPSGAGKGTFVDCVTGIEAPEGGTVRFRGQDVTGLPAHRRVAMGMARTWESPRLEPSLTVLDAVMTAQHANVRYGALAGMLGGPTTFAEEDQLRQNAEEILFFLGLSPLVDQPLARLAPTARKLCGVAIALATDPDMLVLEAPLAGLGPEEARRLARSIRFLRDALNLTILVTEEDVSLTPGLCDYVYVLSAGRLLARGTPEDVMAHPYVRSAYLDEEGLGAAS